MYQIVEFCLLHEFLHFILQCSLYSNGGFRNLFGFFCHNLRFSYFPASHWIKALPVLFWVTRSDHSCEIHLTSPCNPSCRIPVSALSLDSSRFPPSGACSVLSRCVIVYILLTCSHARIYSVSFRIRSSQRNKAHLLFP